MKKTLVLALLSFVFTAPVFADGYDAQTCLEKLAAQGMNACGAQAEQPTDFQCMNFGESSAMQGYCSGKEPYSPIQMSEAFNSATGQAQTFAKTEEMLQFLSENPEYKLRNCYCCC